MRRRRVLVFVAGAAVLLGTGCGQAAAGHAHPVLPRESAGAAGSWGRAIAVPGLAALNRGRNAGVLSVSCPSPGDCAAGGDYRDGGGHQQGFVAIRRNGRWHQAIEVPGLAALTKGRSAEVVSVSCASPGHCAAGGYYGNRSSNPYGFTSGQGFVAVEGNGHWHRAFEVPGLGALNTGGKAEVSSVSCAGPGSCAAVGFYTGGGGHKRGFVAAEVNGVWGRAIEVPGLEGPNTGGNAEVSSVSCASPGNCAAGGFYTDAARRRQAFVVNERNGGWGTAQQVAANLGTGRGASVDTVSCGSAGNCAAAGGYEGGGSKMFVINEVNGTWASAQEVAGNLYVPEGGIVDSLSCASAGNCSAGGTYADSGTNSVFLVGEKNGVWGPGISVPGLNRVARDAFLTSVSCASAGNCAAGGAYDGGGCGAWVVREKNGVWGKETAVPGLGALNKGSVLGVSSVSCASAGSCVAGGYYQETGGHLSLQGFVT